MTVKVSDNTLANGKTGIVHGIKQCNAERIAPVVPDNPGSCGGYTMEADRMFILYDGFE
jgi:hypothetical protein